MQPRPTPRSDIDPPATWHSHVHRGEDYVRSGDLAVWMEREDADLDAAAIETRRRVEGLDALIRRTAPYGAVVEAFHAPSAPARPYMLDPAPIFEGLLCGVALVCWNGARALSRRLQNETVEATLNEESAEVANWKRGGPAFRTLEQALRFHRDGVPPDEDAPCRAAIGLGPLSLVVAKDREEDTKARARLLANGRTMPAGPRRLVRRRPSAPSVGTGAELLALITDEAAPVGQATRYTVALPGGYLPIDFLPCKQSASGSTGGAKGLTTIDLSADVAHAIRAAHLTSEELDDLLALHVGQWQRPAKKARRGELGDERGHGQEVLTSPLLSELARARSVPLVELRDRLSAARARLRCQLERRGLLPGVRDAELGVPRQRRGKGQRARLPVADEARSYDARVMA